MRWTVSKKFGRKLVDEVSDGFNIKGFMQMGDGSTPEIVTDHLQALVLDDLEFELQSRGIADSGGVSKKGADE
jgi:hypothetical protein